MATIYPFRALRPRAELADKVASVPYDVVNRDEARNLAKDNDVSFLHVTKPEIDLPDDLDPHSPEVYGRGALALHQFVEDGVLARDPRPSLYAYQLTMGDHTQTGVVLCASVAEYEQNIVRKHEHTRPDKEKDRVEHMLALGAQSGTVFLAHRDSEAIAREITASKEEQPAVDFVAADDIAHRLWVIDDPTRIERIVAGFKELGPIYIADGHHRSAAASRVAAARRRGREPNPEASWESFLAVSFPASEMQILDYNRVVKDLNGMTPVRFLDRVKAELAVSPGKPEPVQPRQFGMFLDGAWYTLEVRDGTFDANDPVARLDVSLLQNQLLSPLLGIDDPRRDSRIDFVGGIRGTGELELRVHQGAAVAFALHPTSIEDLLAIADAGEVMPPKSTWFEPKLRDGLVVHMLDSK